MNEISADDFLKWKDSIGLLKSRGEAMLAEPYRSVRFTGNDECNQLLNDLHKYPHAFVLACVMDRQIQAERAWLIPQEIRDELGSFDFSLLLSIGADTMKGIFERRRLHRFNDRMAEYFCKAVDKIHQQHGGDASRIWRGTPKSATVVRRFLRFEGVGIKIASMSANILARDFKVPLADKFCIDISPDVHVKRVFTRLGLIDDRASNEELVYRARELNPKYPGVFDLSVWEIGRNWCRPTYPRCSSCYLESGCLKLL